MLLRVLLYFFSLCDLCSSLKYSFPLSTFTQTKDVSYMKKILKMALSHPPAPHIWSNLSIQISRFVMVHSRAFFNLLEKMKVPRLQYLHPLWQLMRKHNMHRRYEWLKFTSQFENDELMSEEHRQAFDYEHIVNDSSDVFKLSCSDFNHYIITAFLNSNPDKFSKIDLETAAKMVKLSVKPNVEKIGPFFSFLEAFLSREGFVFSRSTTMKLLIQVLHCLKDQNHLDKLNLLGLSLWEKCGTECRDLSFLFIQDEVNHVKASVDNWIKGVILDNDSSEDEIILCVLLAVHGLVDENLKSSIGYKSRELAGKMSDWNWLAFVGIVVSNPPVPSKLETFPSRSPLHEQCEQFVGPVDNIYERLKNLPLSSLDVAAFACLSVQQYRTIDMQNLLFPSYLPSNPRSLSAYVCSLYSTYFNHVIKDGHFLLEVEKKTTEALGGSKYFIAIPIDNGVFSVTLRDLQAEEVASLEALSSSNDISIRVEIQLIKHIGVLQFYLQDLFPYRLSPDLFALDKPESEFTKLLWMQTFGKSESLSMLFGYYRMPIRR